MSCALRWRKVSGGERREFASRLGRFPVSASIHGHVGPATGDAGSLPGSDQTRIQPGPAVGRSGARGPEPRAGGSRGKSLLLAILAVGGPLLTYVVVGVWMFQGSLTLGMEYDEVFRVNNLVAVQQGGALPYDQAISSFEILGHSVPLMYKSYISSAFLLWYLPLGLFHDPLVGIRTLDQVSLILSAAVGFLLFRRRAYWAASGIPLLVMVSPLLYPDILFGFADVRHVIPMLVAAWFFQRFVRAEHTRDLFGSALFSAIALNISLYAAWIFAGLAVAALCFYWPTLRSVLTSVRHLGAALLASAIGCFNFLYFNLTQGFPTLRPLIDRFISPDGSNAHPIDFKQSHGVLGDAALRLPLLWGFLGSAAAVSIAIFLVAVAVTLLSFVGSLKARRIRADRVLYVPMLALLVSLAAILVSPNTTRRGHYGMLVVLLECAFFAGAVLAGRLLPKMRPATARGGAIAMFAAFFALNASVSRASVDRQLVTGGQGFFSSAIFELYEYAVEDQRSELPLLQTQWGSDAQLYFLSDGSFTAPSIVFPLLGRPSEQARIQLVAQAVRAAGGAVAIPVYSNVPAVGGVDQISLLEGAAQTQGGSVCTEKVFTDRRGQEQIRLYRLQLEGAGSNDSQAACEAP